MSFEITELPAYKEVLVRCICPECHKEISLRVMVKDGARPGITELCGEEE